MQVWFKKIVFITFHLGR